MSRTGKHSLPPRRLRRRPPEGASPALRPRSGQAWGGPAQSRARTAYCAPCAGRRLKCSRPSRFRRSTRPDQRPFSLGYVHPKRQATAASRSTCSAHLFRLWPLRALALTAAACTAGSTRNIILPLADLSGARALAVQRERSECLAGATADPRRRPGGWGPQRVPAEQHVDYASRPVLRQLRVQAEGDDLEVAGGSLVKRCVANCANSH